METNPLPYSVGNPWDQSSLIEITGAEFKRFESSRERLWILWDLENAFSLIAESYLAFEKSTFDCAAERYFRHWGSAPDRAGDDAQNNLLNLKLLALFTTHESYKSYRKLKLTKFYRSLSYSSEALSEVRKDRQLMLVREKSFEFRLFDELRDYAQHEELPLTGTSLATKWQSTTNKPPDRPFRNRVTLNPYIELSGLRERLTNNRDKLARSLNHELGAISEEFISVNWLVRGFTSAVTNLHDGFRKETEACFKSDMEAILDLHSRYHMETGVEPKLLHIISETGTRKRDLYIGAERFKQLGQIRKGWQTLKNAKHSYISNEIHLSDRVFPKNDSLTWIPE